MKILDEVRGKISNGQFEFSQHAADQTILRRISVQELRDAMEDGEIIEYYPDGQVWSELPDPGAYEIGKAATRPVQPSIESPDQGHYSV